MHTHKEQTTNGHTQIKNEIKQEWITNRRRIENKKKERQETERERETERTNQKKRNTDRT